jgi:hypothetical protein
LDLNYTIVTVQYVSLAAQQNRPFILLALQSQARKNTMQLLWEEFGEEARLSFMEKALWYIAQRRLKDPSPS